VARAKRTDRADARRRYRQYQSADLGDVEGAEPSEAPPVTARGPRPAPGAPARPSLTAAFRAAYHRANIREDVAALPGLLRTRSFVGAIALIVVGTAGVALAPQNPISQLLYQSLLYPPAMAPIFIVGFFAPRASYLLGLIVSVIDVALFAVVVYVVLPATATTTPVDPAAQAQAVYSAISVGPVSGIFFAAAAAWYRRFLNLTNARAQQRRQASPRAGRAAKG
jgi:hypothetical protein